MSKNDENDPADAVLEIPDKGVQLAEEFRKIRFVSKTTVFHSPVKRNNYQSFSKASKTVTVSKNNKVKTVKVSPPSQQRVEKQ